MSQMIIVLFYLVSWHRIPIDVRVLLLKQAQAFDPLQLFFITSGPKTVMVPEHRPYGLAELALSNEAVQHRCSVAVFWRQVFQAVAFVAEVAVAVDTHAEFTEVVHDPIRLGVLQLLDQGFLLPYRFAELGIPVIKNDSTLAELHQKVIALAVPNP